MGSNPINLVLRFILEMAALVSMGFFGWQLSDNWLKFILVILLPLTAMIIWGVFNVPDDPNRSGNAPIKVPGVLRLIIEIVFFSLSVLFLILIGKTIIAVILGALVIIHYLFSWDRLVWLVKQK